MRLTAKLTQILPIETGIGKNGKWEKREVIVRPLKEKSKDICILVWGDKCNDPILVEGLSTQIKFYIQSTQYNGKWNTQVTCTDILPSTEEPELPLSIEIQLEEIFFNDNNLPNFFKKFKRITRNYFHILGRTIDNYKNLIHIGMKGSIDPFTLTRGSILKIPLQIESTLNYKWKTKLYAESFEIVKK